LEIDKTIDMGTFVEWGIRVLRSLDMDNVVGALSYERIGLEVVRDGSNKYK